MRSHGGVTSARFAGVGKELARQGERDGEAPYGLQAVQSHRPRPASRARP
jgi:hypothetical protein